MNTVWKSFREGFLGSFALAGAIVAAVAAVAGAFISGSPLRHSGEHHVTRR